MDSWGETHRGKVRKVNQDVFGITVDVDRNIAILVVCDGMGGANAGHIASQLAADTFIEHVSSKTSMLDNNATLDEIADIVEDAAVASNEIVYIRGINDVKLSGMGTTLVALVSADVGEVVANIGDSRAYHITPAGISKITKDHSVVEEMIDRGEITREEAEHHPRKNLITRAIGAEAYIQADVYTQNIDTDDLVLLCSDGLSNIVSEDEILEELVNSETLEKACEALIKRALSRGAPDNITVAVFRK